MVTRYYILPSRAYKQAERLRDAGSYEQAMEAFRQVSPFKNTDSEIRHCEYLLAVQMKEEGKYGEAVQWFLQAGKIRDAEEQIRECYYYLAGEAMAGEDPAGALAYYRKIPLERDVPQIVLSNAQMKEMLREEWLREVMTPGGRVNFGKYQRYAAGEETDLIWIVVCHRDGCAVLLSLYAYGKDYDADTAVQELIRFGDEAFTSEEKELLRKNETTYHDRKLNYATYKYETIIRKTEYANLLDPAYLDLLSAGDRSAGNRPDSAVFGEEKEAVRWWLKDSWSLSGYVDGEGLAGSDDYKAAVRPVILLRTDDPAALEELQPWLKPFMDEGRQS